jgi:hypothetical protein
MNRNEKAARKKRAREKKRGEAHAVGVSLRPPEVSEANKDAVFVVVRDIVLANLPTDAADEASAGKFCLYVNGLACAVLRALDPANHFMWRVRAGSASVLTGAVDQEGPLAVGYDVAASINEGGSKGEFHVWVVGSVGSETLAVDFTIRDFEFLARRLGIPWTRSAPPYVWGSAATMKAAGVWYESHPLATNEVARAIASEEAWFSRATGAALDRLAAQGVRRL